MTRIASILTISVRRNWFTKLAVFSLNAKSRRLLRRRAAACRAAALRSAAQGPSGGVAGRGRGPPAGLSFTFLRRAERFARYLLFDCQRAGSGTAEKT